MEGIGKKLGQYQFKKQEGRVVERWQDVAATAIKEFGVGKKWQAIVFKHAKKNVSFVERNIALTREKHQSDNNGRVASNYIKKETYGAYFISLFRKNPPAFLKKF